MHERRVFEVLDSIPKVGSALFLNSDNSKHLSSVLRLAVGDPVTVVCLPFQKAFECFIVETSNKSVVVKVQAEFFKSEYESVVSNLAIGLCKMPALEVIIEKATELGVQKFSLIQSDHSVLKLKTLSDIDGKIQRLTKIAVSACKQSSRVSVPTFEYFASVDKFLSTCSNQIKVIASLEPDAKNIKSLSLVYKDLCFTDVCGCIGPEGDFSMSEILQFREANFYFITLGGNRLRSETAAISLVAGFDAVF